jgi:hypothetical protein
MQTLFPLTPSMQHSNPEYRAPTLANPLPLVHMFLPISLKMNAVCARVPTNFSEAFDSGSSYAKVADIREKNAPKPKPA